MIIESDFFFFLNQIIILYGSCKADGVEEKRSFLSFFLVPEHAMLRHHFSISLTKKQLKLFMKMAYSFHHTSSTTTCMCFLSKLITCHLIKTTSMHTLP